MLIIRGLVDDVELTGTLYEPEERPPPFKGAPDEGAPYVWVCDEFYEVESGGQVQHIAGHDVRLAFEHPMPRGFESREQAIEAAKEHVRTQFARIGVDAETVDVEVEAVALDDGGPPRDGAARGGLEGNDGGVRTTGDEVDGDHGLPDHGGAGAPGEVAEGDGDGNGAGNEDEDEDENGTGGGNEDGNPAGNGASADDGADRIDDEGDR